jgi:hypothetical protein
MKSILAVLALALSALAQPKTAAQLKHEAHEAQLKHHRPTPLSAVGAAKGRHSLRIIQNAAEADMVDGHFDPFTAGLLDGLEKELEDDESFGHLNMGDADMNTMLGIAEEWLTFYRVGSYKGPLPQPTRKHVSEWYDACVHSIYVALRAGATTGYQDCDFAEAQDKEINDAIKMAH